MKKLLSVIFLQLFFYTVLAQDYAVLKEMAKDNPLNTAFVGFIVDESGAPIVGARVTLLDIDGRLIKETETKEKGFFALKNVDKGKYLLQGISDYMLTEVRKVSMDLEIRSTKTQIRSVGRIPLTIKIEESQDISMAELSDMDSEESIFGKLPINVLVGSVFDENGKDIVGATVILKKKNGEFEEETQTSDKGTYFFKDLKNGNYTIQAIVEDLTSIVSDVTVDFEASPGFKAHAVEPLVVSQKTSGYGVSETVSKEDFVRNITALMKHQGRAFPAFSLKDYSGKDWSEGDLKGKVTVIVFWHTGCQVSIKEMEEMNTWIDKYPEVNFMSCTWNSSRTVDKIIHSAPFLFIHLLDGQALFDDLDIKMTPTTLIVDERGVIKSIVPGLNEMSYQKIIGEIENRLRKK